MNETILELKFEDYDVPYQTYDYSIWIEYNGIEKNFEYSIQGIYESRIYGYEEKFETFEDAFDEVSKVRFSLCFYKIVVLKKSYKFYFTKKLIEQLKSIYPKIDSRIEYPKFE